MKRYINPVIEVQYVEMLSMIASSSIPIDSGEKANGEDAEVKVVNFADADDDMDF